MAQRSKFIGAPSRNEFWEPQEEQPKADSVGSSQNALRSKEYFKGFFGFESPKKPFVYLGLYGLHFFTAPFCSLLTNI